MIGTITLNPSIDQHWVVEDLVKDDANRARTVHETPGGKGINVSKVIRELGGNTRAYALLGGLQGKLLKELVKPLDFPLSSVEIRGNTRMNTIFTDLKDGTQTRISAPGPRLSASDLRKFVKMLLRAKPKPAFWVFGGSPPRGLRKSVYRDLIWTLQENGTPCVLDADDEALKMGVEARPFMIKPNEFEMQRLCGRKLHTIQDYCRAAQVFIRKGIHLVVVSLASRGALFVTEEQAFRVGTLPVTVKSRVGAGDALIGGVIWGLSQKMPLREAAKYGIAASTSTVMRSAPRLCRRKDIPGLLKRLRVDELCASKAKNG
jgi:1-phosphofructokinase